MDKYIQQLIQNNSRVNIPGFGALMTAGEGGGLMFNQYLNFDDGLISGAIASAEGISEEEAKNRVSQYVENLKGVLASKSEVSINGIGTFRKDGDVIEFIADSNAVNQDGERAPIEVIEPRATDDNANTADNTTSTSSYYYDEEEEKRKRTIIYVLLVVLLFLILAWVCLFVINKDNCVYRLFFGAETEQVEIVPEPEPEPEPVVTEPEPEPVVESTSPEKRYNIIVGSYNDESSAQARVARLKEKGFNDAFVLPMQIKGVQKYLAVIDSSNSLVEAERRQEEIVDNYHIESWMTNSGA